MGLTATPLSKLDGVENDTLVTKRKFSIHDSKVAASFDPDELESCSLEEFIQKSHEAAMLIFTKDNTIEATLKTMEVSKRVNIRVNVTNTAQLRELNKSDLLVTTDPNLLRGFDYKSYSPGGINLLMMASVNSPRALL